MTDARTLPIHVEPLPGEALDSWLEAISHRLRSAHGDTLTSVGLASPGLVSVENSWLANLPAESADHISAVTGQPIERLHQMTIAHYASPRQNITTQAARPSPWSQTRRSRYCPHCLAESGGRWLLQWRLGWQFLCEIHRCLLVDTCPTCGGGQRESFFPIDLIPGPSLCARPKPGATGRSPQRCSADLSATPTTRFPDPSHQVLEAQRALHAVIDDNHAAFGIYRREPVTALECLRDIRAIGGRLLLPSMAPVLKQLISPDLFAAHRQQLRDNRERAAGRGATAGFRARLSATSAATAVSAALSILSRDNLAAAGRALSRLEPRRRSNGKSLDWASAGWAHDTTAALASVRLTSRAPLLSPTEQLRYRIGDTNPGIPTLSHADSLDIARKLPCTLWSDWAVRLTTSDLDSLRWADALPAVLLVVNSRITYSEACAALGSRTITGRTIAHQLKKLAQDPRWPAVRLTLIRLADYLRTQHIPIDYQQRRGIDFCALLPEDTWDAICGQLDIRPGGGKRLHVVRCYLYTAISGNPARLAPWFADSNDFRSALATFATILTPGLLAALREHSQHFLRQNNIDEPLTWSPPRELVDGLTLPGPDPERIPITKLHRLIRRQIPLSDVAHTLGTTPEALRHALTQNPAPSHRRGPTSKPAFGVSELAGQVSAQQLEDLYIGQGMSLRAIGERYGVGRHVVAQFMRRSAIPLRPAHGPRRRDDVERDWLYTEYVAHRRTLPELAAEKAMSTANMARWAHRHQIPLRSRGGPSHTATLTAVRAADSAPALLRPALVGVGGAERLSRFAAASRYPTVTKAADALKIHQGVLQHQINRLAADLGGPLLTRAQRNRPMTPTALGNKVLAALKLWNANSTPAGGPIQTAVSSANPSRHRHSQPTDKDRDARC